VVVAPAGFDLCIYFLPEVSLSKDDVVVFVAEDRVVWRDCKLLNESTLDEGCRREHLGTPRLLHVNNGERWLAKELQALGVISNVILSFLFLPLVTADIRFFILAVLPVPIAQIVEVLLELVDLHAGLEPHLLLFGLLRQLLLILLRMLIHVRAPRTCRVAHVVRAITAAITPYHQKRWHVRHPSLQDTFDSLFRLLRIILMIG